MSDCNCTLREKTVGDGCRVCNPQLVIEHLEDEIKDLRAAIAKLERYFTSGNGINVERATIKADDFWYIVDV